VPTNLRALRLRRGETAFTLIELIVVLAITGAVLALVVPNIGWGSGNSTLAAAAREVAAALRLTRDKAITQNRPAVFVARAGAFGREGDERVWQVPKGVILVFKDSGREGPPRSSGAIRFYPDGSSTGGAFALTNGAMRYTVLVAWINGNVSIQSEPSGASR
jgi:general secretion pathway protein H